MIKWMRQLKSYLNLMLKLSVVVHLSQEQVLMLFRDLAKKV